MVSSPRETAKLIGHEEATSQLRKAYDSGRLPHAWLISGPKGIGKATLAHQFIRFLMAEDHSRPDLEVDAESQAVRRVLQSSHTDLKVLDADINVDAVREVNAFLRHTPAEGKWRVVLIDSADDMNRNAANAILKTLEEPPANSVLLLISHNSGKLLPTIRSRCRALKLKPLDSQAFDTILQAQLPECDAEERMAYYRLSEGSPGVAVFLKSQEALVLYHAILELFPYGKQAPDWLRVHALGGQMAGKQNAQYFEALQYVLAYAFRQIIRVSELGHNDLGDVMEGETQVLQHLAGFKSTGEWLSTWEDVSQLLAATSRIYLDPKQVLINIVSAMQPGKRLAA